MREKDKTPGRKLTTDRQSKPNHVKDASAERDVTPFSQVQKAVGNYAVQRMVQKGVLQESPAVVGKNDVAESPGNQETPSTTAPNVTLEQVMASAQKLYGFNYRDTSLSGLVDNINSLPGQIRIIEKKLRQQIADDEKLEKPSKGQSSQKERDKLAADLAASARKVEELKAQLEAKSSTLKSAIESYGAAPLSKLIDEKLLGAKQADVLSDGHIC